MLNVENAQIRFVLHIKLGLRLQDDLQTSILVNYQYAVSSQIFLRFYQDNLIIRDIFSNVVVLVSCVGDSSQWKRRLIFL